MSTFKPCDYTDCPVHPDYTEHVEEREDGNLFNDNGEMKVWMTSTGNHNHSAMPANVSWSNDYATWTSNSYTTANILPNTDRSTLKLKIGDVEIAAECLVCEHCRKTDMRNQLIVNRAKEELEK